MSAKRENLTDRKNGSPRAEQVRDQILQAIRQRRYEPGERITETEVATWLGVSRTPVREAFRRLETEGLLTFQSWRGVVVADLDRQQVNELYAMRQALEGTAARLAARHIDEPDIDLLEQLLARSAEAEISVEELAKVNRQFHETIYSAAHNRYLLQTLEQLRNTLALLRGTTYAVPGRQATALGEHEAIVRAIRARKPEEAEDAARAHIASAQKCRLQLMAEVDHITA